MNLSAPIFRSCRLRLVWGVACFTLATRLVAYSQQPPASVKVGVEVAPDRNAIGPTIEQRQARVPRITLTPSAAVGSAALATSTLPLLSPQGEFKAVALPNGRASQTSLLLQYAAGFAGKKVVVNPLDGGTINGRPGTQVLSIGADGTLPLVFQCGGQPGTYSVAMRLDTVESSLCFVVSNPSSQGE